ncbi:hypothetical protein B296_00053500 [Ensete ventricosum]|uniref:J domain-containing protein n=1 Tax=Ensete ventricosum TaxID=4639 RepID=A0A426XQA5_ENSVE|nr:hypothetical protein B296_00053500 [Ensete ventricosum]
MVGYVSYIRRLIGPRAASLERRRITYDAALSTNDSFHSKMDGVKPSSYGIRCVERTASQQEIKKAYYKLALRLHPDKNPGDEVTEADIEEFEANYRGSDSEKKDLKDLYEKFKGNMNRLFCSMLCSDPKLDSHRYKDIIDEAIAEEEEFQKARQRLESKQGKNRKR